MAKYYVFLILVVMMFSGNLIVGKAVSDLPPITVAFIRNVIAFLVIMPFGLRQFRQNYDIFRRDWKPLLGFALTGITTFNVLIYLSLNYTTSTNAGIVEATTPVFALIVGYIFLKERLSARQLTGVGLSFIGAVWVLIEGSVDRLLALQINPGDLTMLLAMIVWAFYSLFLKQHNHKYPIYGAMFAMIGLGALLMIPVVTVEWLFVKPSMDWFSGSSLLGLLYLGIFPSVIALYFWNAAVQNLGPSLSSVFLNLLPVFTTIGAMIFLGENVSLAQVAGGVVVVAGVLIATNVRLSMFKRKKEAKSVRRDESA
ncbi:DMT family transporter [Alkalibacillus salilacus]|uniref:Drug/metabolite transporter (DMT)-like permease n=1 Tax=Alkalibacillus salilacus TaxID=284582 RepID=A0ABT9VB38_9BACI|nr:DMT family transporter [Alkalibacillus salilacus]MDQ0158182.1 drug/metabolite transporter (DMT)-like permease [Alkalibacillus salilacus]